MSIKFGAASLAFALSTSTALAGGFERSGLPVGFMFEKGNYGELSFGHVTPKVEGTTNAGVQQNVGSGTSGNIAGSYRTVGVAFKTDLNEKLSLGMTFDPSYGADVSYGTGTTYPVRGSNAKIRGETIALVGRYKLNENLSVIAGVRSVGVGGTVSLSTTTIVPGTPINFYNASFGHTRDIGYVIGTAFEKPEIALRVGLTYASSTNHTLPVTGVYLTPGPTPFTDTTDVELPQSLTLDFQSGVAADTLVFGSVRWVDWTATTLIGPNAGIAANPLVEHDNDSITYNLGVGRKFSDQFSGAISIGYEKSHGGIAGNLSPTDGYKSIQLGGTYTMGNMKISGGVRYVDIGDAAALDGGSNFTGNSALGVGLKIGFSF